MVPDGITCRPCVLEGCTLRLGLSAVVLVPVQLADARSHLGGAAGPGGASVQLQCKHLFHPLCIRGWTMVGECAGVRRLLLDHSATMSGPPQSGCEEIKHLPPEPLVLTKP